MEYLANALNSSRGCYVLGSLLLTLMMPLYWIGHNRRIGRAECLVMFTCLPVVNLLIVAYLLLEGVTKITGVPITIGRKN